jgi:GT2 family glycosyltransferase
MKISIVIPSYNGQKLLEANLPKVISALLYARQEKKMDVEIIVVNDGSSDETIPFMQKFVTEHSDLPVIFKDNGRNLGFSPTVNNGVKAATGDIVILINTDVTPDRNFILPLLPYFEDENTFAVGCMDKSVEGDKIVLRGRGVGKWKEGYMQHRLGDLDKNDTLWVSGGSGAFSRRIWNHIGGLCELYKPYYWEDNDLSYRALKAGYKIYFEKKSTVLHKHEDGVIKKTQPSSKVQKIVNRNQNIFTLLNATDSNLFFSYFLYLPVHILRSFKDKDWFYLLGLLKVIPMLASIFSYRAKYQKLVKISDKEVIESIQA